MLIPTYFPTLMAKIYFLRFNVSWGLLFLSTLTIDLETALLDDVVCVQHNWEMLDNIARDGWLTSTLFFTLINVGGVCFVVSIRQQYWSTYSTSKNSVFTSTSWVDGALFLSFRQPIVASTVALRRSTPLQVPRLAPRSRLVALNMRNTAPWCVCSIKIFWIFLKFFNWETGVKTLHKKWNLEVYFISIIRCLMEDTLLKSLFSKCACTFSVPYEQIC